MKIHEILSEEGYDKQRDADAERGIPRQRHFSPGPSKKKSPEELAKQKERKDKAEKAAMDNVAKVLKKGLQKENSASSVAAIAMPMGKTISRQMKNTDGTAKNALDMDTNIMGQKKKSKRKKA